MSRAISAVFSCMQQAGLSPDYHRTLIYPRLISASWKERVNDKIVQTHALHYDTAWSHHAFGAAGGHDKLSEFLLDHVGFGLHPSFQVGFV